LRRLFQRPRHQSLRTGFSTGTAAAAAAAGALLALLDLPVPGTVEVSLPGGGSIAIPLHESGRRGDWGEARVIKQAGDDPDVTHGAEIGARVCWLNSSSGEAAIRLGGGEGVGRVTKPGLVVAVGEPAINPVPRQMICQALDQHWKRLFPPQPLRLAVEIFVPRGEELARHTLNPRLGIIGGISILGTTGLVKPFSHQAYRATIAVSLRVAQAAGLPEIVLTTGGKSESYVRELLPNLPEDAFIQMADYVRFAVRLASRMGFKQITLAAFFGKALKIAQGLGHTHASQGTVDLQALARLTRTKTGNQELAMEVARANTARGALERLRAAGASGVVAPVGQRLLRTLRTFAGSGPRLAAIILDFCGQPLWQGMG